MIPAVYEPHSHEDPDFPFYFHRRMQAEDYSPVLFHWHESLEFLYILDGCCHVVCGRQTLWAAPGDLVVINSGNLHAIYRAEAPCGSGPESGRAVYHCLIVDKSFCDGLKLFPTDVWFQDRIRSPEAADRMKAIEREVVQRESLYKLRVQSEVMGLLVCLCRCGRVPSPEPSGRGGKVPMVKAVIEYLRLHFAEPLTMDSVCASVGFSRFYVCHAFREITGSTVVAYLNRLRCGYALQLLSSGDYTVSECAEKCGFQTMSYFSKIYRRCFGRSPSADRASRKALPEPNAAMPAFLSPHRPDPHGV